jgi:CRISPR/Cas system Type II protein with McrA/HNH and RuvC-like nuclease domain
MVKILGLDLGTNSIGWVLQDQAINKPIAINEGVFPEGITAQRSANRQHRRLARRRAQRMSFLAQEQLPLWVPLKRIIDFTKRAFPIFIHTLLGLLLAGSLIMAITQAKDFQFWFNLAITVLLGWIAMKK